MGSWVEDTWCWGDLGISIEDLGNCLNSFLEVMTLLEKHKLTKGKEDEVVWLKEDTKVFTVRSCYTIIVEEIRSLSLS